MKTTNDWLIVPGERVGPITATWTEDMLVAYFGRENVRRGASVCSFEGTHRGGTFLYADRPALGLGITWKDRATRSLPGFICIGSFTGASDISQWHSAEGISLGTSLQELEKLNGWPFQLYGFGWDYSGCIHSWDGGNLARVLVRERGTLALRLAEPPYHRQPHEIYGDGPMLSTQPLLRKLNPGVFMMYVSFR